MTVLVPMPRVPKPRYCAAKRADGEPCKKPPLSGSTLCRNHLGSTGVQKRHAAKRLELARAEKALQELGIDRSVDAFVDPRIVLLQAVSVAHQTLQVVLEMMRSLNQDDLNALGELTVPGVANTARGARAEAFFSLLATWTEKAAKVSQLALRVGLEDRMVRLAETQASLLVGAVRAAFLTAGTPSDIQEPFLAALAEQLRLVSIPGLTDVASAREAHAADAKQLPIGPLSAARLVSAEGLE